MLDIMKYGMKFAVFREFSRAPKFKKRRGCTYIPEPNMIYKFYFVGKFDKGLFSEFQVNNTSFVFLRLHL